MKYEKSNINQKETNGIAFIVEEETKRISKRKNYKSIEEDSSLSSSSSSKSDSNKDEANKIAHYMKQMMKKNKI